MRLLSIAATIALLGGCSTFGMSAAQVAQMDQQKCTSYGFRVGTDAYASCMQNIELSRAADDRSRRAAFRAMSADLLNDNTVTCNSTGTTFGGVRNTTTTCR